jgi:3-oxoacyl-[acyl-carrier-protein] synthase III
MSVQECNALLEKAGFSKDDLDWFVPHSANMRMIESICENTSVWPSDSFFAFTASSNARIIETDEVLP